MKETLSTDDGWMKVDYTIAFFAPIYGALQKIYTNMTYLHFVYEMWDSMMKNVTKVISNEKERQKLNTYHSQLNIN